MSSVPLARSPHPVHVLPPLPYATDALEPVISAETLSFHYARHHKDFSNSIGWWRARVLRVFLLRG